MVRADDIVRLACDPGLAENGIAYACRSLGNHHIRADLAGYRQFRRLAAGAMTELAFRHHLVEQNVPFEVTRPMPFGDPNRFMVKLRGRRCELRTFLITDPRQAAVMRANPGILLDVPALVPTSDYADEGKSPEDMCLFAFLPANVAEERDEAGVRAGLEGRSHLMFLMPAGWAHPRSWMPLGPLIVKAESGNGMEVEIGGEDREKQPLVVLLNLPPGGRLVIQEDFHSLTYVHARTRVAGRLGLRSPSRPSALVIGRGNWHDAWLDARELYLVGWLSREEFRNRAGALRAGSHVWQFYRTRVDNLAVRVSDLKPIGRLFEQASKSRA